MEYVKQTKPLISVEGIICILFRNSRSISFKRRNFYRSFYNIRIKNVYSDILNNICFSGSEINQYSEELSTALFNLQFCDAISSHGLLTATYYTSTNYNEIYKTLTKML